MLSTFPRSVEFSLDLLMLMCFPCVLAIVDAPRTGGLITRTLSTWVRDSASVWTQGGTTQSCTMPNVRRDASARIEWEIMPARSQSGADGTRRTADGAITTTCTTGDTRGRYY